nr:zinc finger, CCHC-type [Tanacetum cinerariifolium]
MDVKTAFLNGDLEEKIYMNQPEGFIAPGQEDKVYRLVKSLYDSKQAPKQWHQKFNHAMLESGFKINECEKCVYVKDTSSGYVILCLYVDYMLIIGSNEKMIKSTKDMLKSKFDMKDMGLADVILRIKIIQTQNGLVLSQAHYVDKILNTHNAGDSGLARTPIDTSLHLSKNKGVGVAQLEYSRIISMLMYLMTSTRPDLAYVVSRLIGYIDANWISDIKDSPSTSRYVFTLGGATISWNSSKQTVIAKSTIEAEFIALDKCGEEAEWLRQFVDDILRLAMSSDNAQSAVTYTSISSNSDGPSWGIPLMNAGELLEMDPYEEVAQQWQVHPLSPAYIPDPMELDEHAPIYVPEPQHPEYHAPSDDDIQVLIDAFASGSSLFLLSPTSPAYDQAQFGCRVAMIHRKDDILMEDMPSQRIFALTSPPPGCDVAESSAAAAARAPRSQYDFVDTVEAGQGLIYSPGHDTRTIARAADRAEDASYAPLAHRTTMIRMRDDIPEEDMPPQRRFRLTAPPPRCDVAESSASAAARAPRSQYDFVNTVEAGQGLIL